MAKRPYTREGNVIRVSTGLEEGVVDYQITVHLENLNAHYGRSKMRAFLREFYFGAKSSRQAGRKKASNE
jgi:hypothetical protein